MGLLFCVFLFDDQDPLRPGEGLAELPVQLPQAALGDAEALPHGEQVLLGVRGVDEDAPVRLRARPGQEVVGVPDPVLGVLFPQNRSSARPWSTRPRPVTVAKAAALRGSVKAP